MLLRSAARADTLPSCVLSTAATCAGGGHQPCAQCAIQAPRAPHSRRDGAARLLRACGAASAGRMRGRLRAGARTRERPQPAAASAACGAGAHRQRRVVGVREPLLHVHLEPAGARGARQRTARRIALHRQMLAQPAGRTRLRSRLSYRSDVCILRTPSRARRARRRGPAHPLLLRKRGEGHSRRCHASSARKLALLTWKRAAHPRPLLAP